MNNQNQSSKVQTRHITFSLVFAWIFGIFIGVPAIITLFTQPLMGIILLIATAIILPPTYNLIKNKLHISLSKALKVVLVIILIIIAGTVMKKDIKPTIVSKDSVVVEENQNKPVIKVSAIKIINDYSANEVAADAKYKDSPIEVTGIINSVGKDVMGIPYITVSGDQFGITNVQCMFAQGSESELAKVSKGEQITLRGNATGKVIINVLLSGCQIVK